MKHRRCFWRSTSEPIASSGTIFSQVRTEYYAHSKSAGKPQGLNYFQTTKLLTELKKEREWLYEISSQSLQQTLRNLDNAFTAFFKKNNDYPNFRSKKDNQYFVLPQGAKAEKNRLIVQKFPEGVKFRDKHMMPETIKQVIVTKDVTRYYASVFYESDETPGKGDQQIGVDVGLRAFATLSNGMQIDNLHLINGIEKKIQKAQRDLSRKQKGSINWRKNVIMIRKLHQKLKDGREDFLHKASTAIAKLSDAIVMEDLNVQGMMHNHHLAKGIGDVSWYRFRQMLQYKSEWRGIEFIEIGRFEPSSRTCSRCGWHKRDLKLSDRTFHCEACGLDMDRDLNAAINIRNIGLIKVGRGTPEFTPVEIATSAELLNMGRPTRCRSLKQEPHGL